MCQSNLPLLFVCKLLQQGVLCSIQTHLYLTLQTHLQPIKVLHGERSVSDQ